MIRIKPAVIETEDNFHMVYIGREYNPVFIGIAGGDTETALCDVLEYVYVGFASSSFDRNGVLRGVVRVRLPFEGVFDDVE